MKAEARVFQCEETQYVIVSDAIAKIFRKHVLTKVKILRLKINETRSYYDNAIS